MTDQTIDSGPLTIPVDTELGSWRFSLILFFFVGIVISYLIFDNLIPGGGLNILAGILSVVVTALAAQQIERLLKRRSPGNRRLQISDNCVRLMHSERVQHEIDGSNHTNVLMWRFKINRRARVPKGWFMLACALEQEQRHLAIYTFMPPQQAEALGASAQFTGLQSRQNARLKTVGRDDLRLAGEQRRLHQAEAHRWHEGAEMSPDDFVAYLDHLRAQFPQWMP